MPAECARANAAATLAGVCAKDENDAAALVPVEVSSLPLAPEPLACGLEAEADAIRGTRWRPLMLTASSAALAPPSSLPPSNASCEEEDDESSMRDDGRDVVRIR